VQQVADMMGGTSRQFAATVATRIGLDEIVKKLYLEDNLTQSKIAKIVGLSTRRIGQILGSEIISKTNTAVVSEWLQNPNQTQEQIAKNYEITQSRVSQILRL
jgi:predicted XRE-type DNA-binding protein